MIPLHWLTLFLSFGLNGNICKHVVAEKGLLYNLGGSLEKNEKFLECKTLPNCTFPFGERCYRSIDAIGGSYPFCNSNLRNNVLSMLA